MKNNKKELFMDDLENVRSTMEKYLANGLNEQTNMEMNSCLYAAKESSDSYYNSQERKLEDQKDEFLFDMEKLLKIINKMVKKSYWTEDDIDNFQDQLESTICSMETYYKMYNELKEE